MVNFYYVKFNIIIHPQGGRLDRLKRISYRDSGNMIECSHLR